MKFVLKLDAAPATAPSVDYFVYHQPWFKDDKNHTNMPFFQLGDAEYARVPEAHRRLFSWIEHYRTGLY